MRRSTITEQQRAAALLLAAGQHEYKEIARMIGVHRNSISSWARDPRILELVEKLQGDIEGKLEDMSIEATRRKHNFGCVPPFTRTSDTVLGFYH